MQVVAEQTQGELTLPQRVRHSERDSAGKLIIDAKRLASPALAAFGKISGPAPRLRPNHADRCRRHQDLDKLRNFLELGPAQLVDLLE